MRLEDPRSFVAMYELTPGKERARGRSKPERTYDGEESGTNIASWLNGHGAKNSPASRKRIEGLLDNLRKVLAIVATVPPDFDWDNAGYSGPPVPESFEESTLELANRLQDYPTCPFFWVDVGRQWYIEDGVWGSRPAGESVAAHSIIAIAVAGLLDRIDRCDCGNWYFARFRHQRSCSAACRRNLYEKTEKFKAKRRKYMRKYYRLKNSGKVK
jgi:hypothetical protein